MACNLGFFTSKYCLRWWDGDIRVEVCASPGRVLQQATDAIVCSDTGDGSVRIRGGAPQR